MRIPARPAVIIRSCRDYDPAAIQRIVREGLEELGLRPFGRTLVKPNLVAAGPMFPYAYTRPEFGEGVLRALRRRGRRRASTELAVGERCGITIPTRVAFEDVRLRRRCSSASSVKRYCFEEEPQVEIPLHPPGAAARLRVHARAGRARRLLRQLPQVQGAPVDDGHVLDEELHRHPGRPPPPDRPRPPAQREDRRPAVHHPAAVHRHRRASPRARAAC